MKIRSKTKMSSGLLILLLSACALMLVTSQAVADDLDLDGSDCYVEAYGYCAQANEGTFLPAANDLGAFFPNVDLCNPNVSGTLSDPANKDDPDLYVILANVLQGSLLRPADTDGTKVNWLAMISKNVPGLTKPLHVHRVNRNPYLTTDPADLNRSRSIIMTADPNNPVVVQKSVRIYENLSTTSGALGMTPQQGTPNTDNDIAVYTARIENFVTSTCLNKTCVFYDPLNNGSKVTINSGDPLTPLFDALKKQVIAHEAGHTMWLTPTFNTKLNAYHYASSQTGTIMEASVYYTGKTTVTWYFPTSYAAADVPKLR